MKKTTTTYDIAELIHIEVTRYPRQKEKHYELIIAGEGKRVYPRQVLEMISRLEEIKKDFKLKP